MQSVFCVDCYRQLPQLSLVRHYCQNELPGDQVCTNIHWSMYSDT